MYKLFTVLLLVISSQVLAQPMGINSGNKVYLSGTDGGTLSLQCTNGKLNMKYKYPTYDVDFFIIERQDGPATKEDPYVLLYGTMTLPQQKALEQLFLVEEQPIIVTRYPKGTQELFFREIKKGISMNYTPIGQEFFHIEHDTMGLIKELKNACNNSSVML